MFFSHTSIEEFLSYGIEFKHNIVASCDWKNLHLLFKSFEFVTIQSVHYATLEKLDFIDYMLHPSHEQMCTIQNKINCFILDIHEYQKTLNVLVESP